MKSWMSLGIALSAASVIGCAVLADTNAPSALVIAGLVALVVAGGIAPAGRLVAAMALVIPGAALVGLTSDLDRPDWISATVMASIIVAAPLVADADARWARLGGLGGGPVAFAVATAGLFGCVPDTEEARVLLVVALAAAVLSLLPHTRLHTLGSAGAMASTGVFVWIAAFDARGRPAAVVGGVAALGLLVWEPVGVRIRRARPSRVHGRSALLGGFAVHVALCAYASRVVGLERSVGVAVLLVVPAAVAGIAAGVLLGPATDRHTKS